MDNRVFVAVPEDLRHGMNTLKWTLSNLVKNADSVVTVVHVHRPEPEPTIHWMGENNGLIEDRRKKQREEAEKKMDVYVAKCKAMKVIGAQLIVVNDDVAKGLQEIIDHYSITKLVMGDAADEHYLEKRKALDSKTAIRLQETAASTCKIWFTCNGQLISIRDAIPQSPVPTIPHVSPWSETERSQQSSHNHSDKERCCDDTIRHRELLFLLQRQRDQRDQEMKYLELVLRLRNTKGGDPVSSDDDDTTEAASHQISNLEENTTTNREDHNEAKESLPMAKEKERRRYQRNMRNVNEKKSPLTNTASQNPVEVRNEDEESFRHVQMPRETDKWIQGGLHNANVQSFTTDQKITEIQNLIRDVNNEIATNKYFLGEQEDTAVTEDRSSLHENNDEITAMALPAETLNTEFSFSELMQAMERSNNTLMGEGPFGKVYKGFLRSTDVAIKRLHEETVQGESDFNQKVAVLSRVRHPNLVTLIGVCREALCLVYEFLPNGSLQDRLACNNKMPPLTWQVRTKIICEMCSALIFLHSNEPQPVVHGDLKLSNVLLDANFVSKLGDFGICMDGDTTTQSDVHSFGVIILQLLAGSGLGLSPEDVAKRVQELMEKEELHTVLDPTAGNWPIALANQLALIGLRCVRMNQEERPDLVGDVWKELESHKNAGILTRGQGDDDPPSYFICPITRDVMENPHFAADGHTYELEAILQWIRSDHGKSSGRSVRSPMTNLKLEHFKLTPNLALSSEIKEWKEKQQQKQVRSLVCDPHPVPVHSEGHTIIVTPEEAQSQPPISLLPQVSSSLPTTVIPSLTDGAGSSSLTQSPNTALPTASSSPPTTLISSTASDAHSRSTTPLNTSAASASLPSLNPLPANPRATASPPPRPVISPASSTTFLPSPTGIRRRRVVNDHLPSSSTEADVPGETSRIGGKSKHE